MRGLSAVDPTAKASPGIAEAVNSPRIAVGLLAKPVAYSSGLPSMSYGLL